MKNRILFVFAAIVFSLYSPAQIPNYVPINGLQGYWPFTGNANDLSVNANNGLVTGATLTSDRFNAQNSAYSFNGLSDQISTQYAGVLGANPRAVSFWAKTQVATVMPTVVWGGITQGSRYGCGFTNGIGITAAYSVVIYNTPGNGADNVWHHYVLQFSTPVLNLVQVFCDGVLLTQTSNTYNPTTPLNTSTLTGVCFGKYAYAPEYYNGKLDDVAIWDRVLTHCEIQQLFNSSLSSINLSASSASICAGQSTTLNVSGASNYTWVTLSTVSNSVNVSPNSTTTYPVISDCGATNTITVYVNPKPNINITTNAQILCFGQIATLNASGGISYLWNGGANGSSIFVSPAGNTAYTVTGIDANGCSAISTITQSVALCGGIGSHSANQSEIIISPNPSEGIFLIKGFDENSKIEVFDALGTIIHQISPDAHWAEVNLTNKAPGIYFVKLRLENIPLIKKVIKD